MKSMDTSKENRVVGKCSVCGKKAEKIGAFYYYCEKDGFLFFDYPEITDELSCCKAFEGGKTIGNFLWDGKAPQRCDLKTFMNLDGAHCSVCGRSYTFDQMREFVDRALCLEGEKKALLLVSECKSTLKECDFSDDGLEDIRKSRDGFAKYLMKAIEVEESLYLIEQRIRILCGRMFSVENELLEEKEQIKEIEHKMLADELDMAMDTLSSVWTFREKYYAPEVVYYKYRNLPALSKLYEYIKAGRCEALEGFDGGYNLYESELRSDQIIDKLDVVIEKLDDITKNQEMLSHVMKRACAMLDGINDKTVRACSELNRIQNNTTELVNISKTIENNTAIAAYYAERTSYYSKITSCITVANFLGI